MDINTIDISICSFNDGKFQIFIKDPKTHRELVFEGKQELNESELELAQEIAPACVYTRYKR